MFVVTSLLSAAGSRAIPAPSFEERSTRSGSATFRGAGEWGRHANWDWMNGIYPVARLTGTLVRVTLLVLLDDAGSVRRQDARRTDRRSRRGRSGEVVVRRLPRGDAVHPRSHHDGGRARHLDHRHPAARAAAGRDCRAARRDACRVYRRGLSHRPAAAGQGGCAAHACHTQRRSPAFS